MQLYSERVRRAGNVADANCYLLMSKAMDLHDVARSARAASVDEALKRITAGRHGGRERTIGDARNEDETNRDESRRENALRWGNRLAPCVSLLDPSPPLRSAPFRPAPPRSVPLCCAADTLVIGVEQDALIPASEAAEIARGVARGGGHAELKLVSSELGHDAMFSRKEHAVRLFAAPIKTFLERPARLYAQERYDLSGL